MNSKPSRTAIAVARYSIDEQGKTPTIARQLEMIRKWAPRNNVKIIEEVRIEGKSALKGEHLPIIRSLIQRKRERDDFDALVFMAYNRFSRNIEEARRLKLELKDAGIVVGTVKEGFITGKIGWLLDDIYAIESQSYVEQMTFAMLAARIRKILAGDLPPCPVVPYGMDKLYLNSNNEPLYIVRRIDASTYLKLDPTTHRILETIRKQKYEPVLLKRASDKIRLVPGAPECVATVNRIFKAHLDEGLTCFEIKKQLREAHVTPPRGRLWRDNTIYNILTNTLYTGRGYLLKTRSGFLMEMSEDGPYVYDEPRRHKEGYKAGNPEHRSPKEWVLVPQPQLVNFLPKGLCERAIKWQDQQNKKAEERKRGGGVNRAGRVSGGNRHDTSRYPLAGLISVKGTDRKAFGSSLRIRRECKGTVLEKVYRRYRVQGSFVDDAKASHRLSINAESLEEEVLGALQDTLKSFPNLGNLIRRHMKTLMDNRSRVKGLKAKVDERERIERHMTMLARLPERAQNVVEKEMHEHTKTLERLNNSADFRK